jgi:hypothetical protein
VGEAEVAANSSEALRAALQGGAWRRTVFLEPSASDGARGPAADLGEPSEIRIQPVLDTCNASAWKVHGPTAGWFVLRDLYWPGWCAEVDGRPAPVLAADGVFRAVALPPGDHTVVFRYAPSSLRWGLVLTLLCGMAVLAVALVGRFRARGVSGA